VITQLSIGKTWIKGFRLLDLCDKKTVITEDILRQLFGMFKYYVAEINIPEKMIISKAHVDVIFKIKIVDMYGGGGSWLFKITIHLHNLISKQHSINDKLATNMVATVHGSSRQATSRTQPENPSNLCEYFL